MKTAVITGITGQDGAYLSRLLSDNEYTIIGLVRSCAGMYSKGLQYLGVEEQVLIEECDLLDVTAITRMLEKYKPSQVYNLAAQSSVGMSFARPLETIQFNIVSVLNLLESIKNFDKNIRFYQASSSEMFGKVENLPVTENTTMHPLSPYGISKASAHWTTVHYREAFGLYACCGILFNHESFLRREGFFVKKVIKASLEIAEGKRENLRLGNIDVRRDFGYGPAYVKAMVSILQNSRPSDYVICSGYSISLQSIVEHVFRVLGIPADALIIDRSLYRLTDIFDIYGSSEKAKKELNWEYNLDFFDVLDSLIEEEKQAMYTDSCHETLLAVQSVDVERSG